MKQNHQGTGDFEMNKIKRYLSQYLAAMVDFYVPLRDIYKTHERLKSQAFFFSS
jgi:hypothetical protein